MPRNSLKTLDKFTGVVRRYHHHYQGKSVFDEDKTWNQYAAFFNLVDIVIVVYIGYFSSWGRNAIISWQIRSKKD